MGQNTKDGIQITTQLYPAYYPEFQCIADRCHDNCCRGWRIYFSKKDYLKIKRAKKTQELEVLTKKAMRRLADGMRTEQAYGEFVVQNAPCPYQNEQGLCQLQLVCGENTLPEVCRQFPRTESYTPMALEKSMSTGCEAVVELLWNRPEGLEFVIAPLEKQRQHTVWSNGRGEDFPVFRSAMVDIMQARQFSLSRRMLILGLAFDQAIKNWDILDINQWQNQVKLLCTDSSLTQPLETLQGNRQAFLAQNMRTARRIAAEDGGYLRYILNKYRNLHFEKSNGGIFDQFDEQFYIPAKTKFDEAFGDIEYFFENLLVNIAFFTQMPLCATPEVLWQSYVMLCNTYSFFRFLSIFCCGMEPTREKLIQSVVAGSRDLLHNSERGVELRDNFFKNDSATLAHMAVLVKG